MPSIDWVSAFAICASVSLLTAAWLRSACAADRDARTGLRRVAIGLASLGLGLLPPLLGGPAAPPALALSSAAAVAAGLLMIAWGLHTLRSADGGSTPRHPLRTLPPLRVRALQAGTRAGIAAVAVGVGFGLLALGPHAAHHADLPPALQDALALAVGVWPVAIAMLAMMLARGRLLSRLHVLERTDDLTGCLARRALVDGAPRVVQRALVDGRRAAVMVIDMDRFKTVNDRHGHRAGDAVLSAVAARLRAHLRAEALLVRHGGGTFVLVMAVDDERNARLVAERLRLAICERPVHLLPEPAAASALSIDASISVGLAWAQAPASVDVALGQAEAALARAKRAGRNRVEFAVTAMARPVARQRDSQPATL